MTIALLILAVFWLAYSNGANDNFKGVATLYGSRTTSFKKALLWATVSTLAGSLLSVLIAGRLVATFSGKGLVPPSLAGTPQLLIAVGAGSAITILLATRLGLPTSTTHALTGGLVGVALIASIGGLQWGTLLNNFVGPLILSPLIAVALSTIFYPILRQATAAISFDSNTCVCVGTQSPALARIEQDGAATLSQPLVSALPVVQVDSMEKCIEAGESQPIRIDTHKVMDLTHYLSAGSVCLSRALNDTPKIAALLVAANLGNSIWKFGLVTLAVAAGGLLNSRRVAETMSKRITDLNSLQGLSANLVTSFLVLFASKIGVPVSTTHVSCGSIFGIGLASRTCRWKTVAEITGAWITTLPLSAALCGLAFWLIQQVA